jgi:hypothetical protein
MDQQNETLPLARMASVSSPVFWIYAVLFTGLYVYIKIIDADPFYSLLYIVGCVFTALFLTLITQAIKMRVLNTIIKVVTYAFEAISLLFLILSLIFRLDHKG